MGRGSGRLRFAYLHQRRINKGAAEEINILESLSLHPMVYLTVSKVSQTWSLEPRTITENKWKLKSHVPGLLLSCDACCVDAKVA